MSLLIAGSIATDHLMSYQGKFADSLVVEQLDKLSVSFLVDDEGVGELALEAHQVVGGDGAGDEERHDTGDY